MRRFRPNVISKTVADPNTPEPLSQSADIFMAGIRFIAEKALGVENVGEVIIQCRGVDGLLLQPGGSEVWVAPTFEAGYYTPDDFYIKVATAGDGVRVLYSSLRP